ncbi:uncharacterized protein BCR38DRAFT_412564 [Pseudomassariella vexata]|uniref:Uncharacterized protein n=1 Tax=Pseudomassariella vexata TaxID=1141098 RepID=A0A1Y2DK62_9PEZI|nr:uncharacterized protein BCR38DRAFT_412564 [Pseudomassariella vexata]ORY59554.1 hypothetical protein BCR38DRAFT_412564 [Pseudomassariella vexata]
MSPTRYATLITLESSLRQNENTIAFFALAHPLGRGIGEPGQPANMPPKPGLAYLFTANLTISPATPIGATPTGNMTVLTFGRVNGSLLPPRWFASFYGQKPPGAVISGIGNPSIDGLGVFHQDKQRGGHFRAAHW